MSQVSYAIQPTVKQILASDALSEAQVLCGKDLSISVSQVISSVGPNPRIGSLLVATGDSLAQVELSILAKLSGLILVKTSPDFGARESIAIASREGQALSKGSDDAKPAQNIFEALLKRLVKRCSDAGIPLILVPSYGDPTQVIEDVRYVFLRELKMSSARLYSAMLSIALEEGLEGLIEAVSGWINRPLVVESTDFKLLAGRNMGTTPVSQQKALTDESIKSLRSYQKNLEHLSPKEAPHLDGQADLHISPVRLGRRMVFPVPLSDVIVGYVSVMIRPQDDVSYLCEYMHPLALACKVDFSHRVKDSPSFSINQKTLLKDLLSGLALSAADQERLERHFGFDLWDGFYVFAFDTSYPENEKKTPIVYPDDDFISCEAEGMRAFVAPYLVKEPLTWQAHAAKLIERTREKNPGVIIRLGAGRKVESMLDLPDAYGEARQAFVIGSMIHGEEEFSLGYGELGVKRLLYLVFDHPELDRFLAENLRPLEAYDEEWESELVDTLRVYLQQGANLNSTARALFIHRHTLRYRLEQIADILKVDIDSQEVLLNLQIAFLIRDMKDGVKKK